uniref:Uncharacterized protein n=1 Tax=Romanomermis culicivorax TaxID=13658 RepID=A0A915IN15_ROMCU
MSFSTGFSFFCYVLVLVEVKAEIPYDQFIDKALNHERVCIEPPAFVGMCRAAFPRFSFHKSDNQCKRFIYGGCDGNENNFETEGHCKRVCIDKQTCPVPELQKPREGCRYDESLNEKGCPKYVIVCDVKSGKCPNDHAKAHQDACVVECGYGDDKCPGAEKCCKIGCNRICVAPTKA